MAEKQIKTFNDLFRFYESGKVTFKKCLNCEEECGCHYSGTFQVITDIDFNENKYKTREITVKSGGGLQVSEESAWQT